MAKKEAQIQTEFVDWCRVNGIFVASTPNEGCTSIVRGKKLNDMGREAGMPDITIPYPRGGYGALYLEFKKPGGKSTKKQLMIQDVLRYCGNMVEEVNSFDKARNITMEYLDEKYERKFVEIAGNRC